MRKAVTALCAGLLLLSSGLLATGCDPQECKALKTKVCSMCEESICTKLKDKSDSAENCSAVMRQVETMDSDFDKLGDPEKKKQAIKVMCDHIGADKLAAE